MFDVSNALQTALQQLRTERAKLDDQVAAVERAMDGVGGKRVRWANGQLA